MKKHIHGGNVYQYQNCIDFSANCNPLGTPEGVKAAIAASLDHLADYPRVGCAPLKAAIANREQMQAEQIICGNGAAELIFSLCHAKKPKKALVAAPTFAEYEQALDSVDCEVEHFFLKEEEDFRITERILKNLLPGLDLVFLCNPNNPTGLLIDRELLTQILEKCTELGIFLVVDECFLDFVECPEEHTLKGMLEDHRNLFLLKAFTKRYAMAGVRLGYGLCSDERLLKRMEQMTQPWNVSTMAQEAGMAALKETEYVKEGRNLVFREREFLKEKMKELGLFCFPSQANYLFFKGPKQLFEACVSRGILIRDCSNYPGLGEGYYRIAVKKHEANEKLICVLQEVLKEESL